MAAIIFIILTAFMMFYFMRTRMQIHQAHAAKKTGSQLQDYLEALRETRMIGDFVLTGAAIPAPEIQAPPSEGYRQYPHEGYFKINGGSIVVASVSAEKMRGLMLSFIELLGDTASISFTDYHSDAKHIVDYIAYNRDAYMVANVLDNNWRMILNNADIVTSLFSTEIKVEIVLSQAKTVHIHAVETAPFVRCLRDYGLSEKPDMHFIYEDAHYLYSDAAVSGEFFQMVKSFGYDEKRFYEKEEQDNQMHG